MSLQRKLSTIPHRSLSLNKGRGRIGGLGLSFLNGAQFLGALNDNLFKFLNIYLLIDFYGKSASNDVLFWVGVYYVAPFLLFSTLAGVLADRYSKQKIIVLLKIAEIVIIGASFFVFGMRKAWGCYLLVFLLSTHSALLGPSKYSIIPELVKKEKISKANGSVTSFTYLAIIAGTFLASFLTQISNRNFLFCTTFCMIAAIVGLLFAIYIPHTEPRRNKRKIRANIFSHTYQTLKICRRTPLLVLAVCGSAFFLFIGAFLQLNIIPFAIENLNMSEIEGGYLFLGAAIGIATGSVIAGKSSRRGVELGLSCMASFALAACIFSLPMLSHALTAALVLFFLGLFGGMYVVPLESYIQTFSASDHRGQIVAAENFLSFLGVLLAPFCLFFFSKVLNASAALGFTLIGTLIAIASVFMVLKIGGVFFNYLSRKFIQPFYEMHLIGSPFQFKESRFAVLSSRLSVAKIALLLGENPKIHLFIVKERPGVMDRVSSLFGNIDYLYFKEDEEKEMAKLIEEKTTAHVQPLFVFSSKSAIDHFYTSKYREVLTKTLDYQFRYVTVKHTSHFKPSWKKFYKRTQITYHFDTKGTPFFKPSSDVPSAARSFASSIDT